MTIVVVSFWDYDFARIIPSFILTNYAEALASPVTWRTYLNTIRYAAIVWALTALIGFTVAYFLAFHVRTNAMRMILFLVCTVPFLTSNIIRMISWIPFLGRNGLLNGTLIDLGLINQPLEFLLFSDFAVVLAMVHLYVLFMVTPIFNTLMRIDRTLIEAARDGGASGWQTLDQRRHPARQARHRHRLDLRGDAGDGRVHHGPLHERRPERLGGADDVEPDLAAAVPRRRGPRRHPA